METKTRTTRDKVIDAASLLFYQKGFHGTSVRDIADKANINVSLISYYFKSKQGLLENAVMSYYEEYIDLMEYTIDQLKEEEALDLCKSLIHTMLEYRIERYQLTSFINRELQLDSTFVREMTVTYLAKENHLLGKVFGAILQPEHQQKKANLLIQLKGMMISPFIYISDWENTVLDQTDRKLFIRQYTTLIENWLDYLHN